MNLTHLGQTSALPASPEEAVLDYVPNPRPNALYLARFAAPEFTSLCPVTGQPDFASVQISYTGPRIEHEDLLRYLVSYREHPGFHEHCVERIFLDLMARCAPRELSVYARFLRRGGIDINPFRSTSGVAPPAVRLVRQ